MKRPSSSLPWLTRSFFAASLLLSACEPPTPKEPPRSLPPVPEPPRAPTSATPAPAPVLAPLDIDPTVRGMTAKGSEQDCDEGIGRASALASSIEQTSYVSNPPGYEATLGRLDDIHLALRNAGDFAQLMAVAHPDPAVREAAKGCEPKIERFETQLLLNERVAGALRTFAATNPKLSPVRARFLAHALRDFRRNGLELDATGKTRLRALNEELTGLTQAFETNLSSATLYLDATPKQLDGLPKAYTDTHKPGPDGKIKVSTNYPDYFPVVQYGKDRAFALALYKQFDNRAADKNLPLLDKILALRAEKAKLLGYATWADYVLEPRMAKTPTTVAAFLDDLKKHTEAKEQTELKEFRAVMPKLGMNPKAPLLPPDRVYLEDVVRKEKYGLDSKLVSEYLEVGAVRDGLLKVTERLFKVRYRPSTAPTWHPDVTAMEVLGEDGAVLGRFYFDLHPRDGKYKHAAVFSIRDARVEGDGKRLMPIAAIVCNFPKGTSGAPGLMSHQDTVTFFHEFGHVLHHLLSRAELSRYAGTNVERDFVEAPSQMLEEWAWAKETLDMFAKHHKTGEPMPVKLHQAMLRSRSFGRALQTTRQLFLAGLDQAYHTRGPGIDTTKVLEEVQNKYSPFRYVEGTHFQATFGHLMGYDAGYYGYQWALAMAQDMFSRFRAEGMYNDKTASDYRRMVLEPGGSDDAANLVQTFLGRPGNLGAYKTYLSEVPKN